MRVACGEGPARARQQFDLHVPTLHPRHIPVGRALARPGKHTSPGFERNAALPSPALPECVWRCLPQRGRTAPTGRLPPVISVKREIVDQSTSDVGTKIAETRPHKMCRSTCKACQVRWMSWAISNNQSAIDMTVGFSEMVPSHTFPQSALQSVRRMSSQKVVEAEKICRGPHSYRDMLVIPSRP